MHTFFVVLVIYLCVNGFLRFLASTGPESDRVEKWGVVEDLMAIFFLFPVLLFVKSRKFYRWIRS